MNIDILSAFSLSFLEPMGYQSITDELIELPILQGIRIRRDTPGSSGGGLCVISDKKTFFLDTDLSSLKSAASCARAATEAISDLGSIHIKPPVRDFIDNFDSNG